MKLSLRTRATNRSEPPFIDRDASCSGLSATLPKGGFTCGRSIFKRPRGHSVTHRISTIWYFPLHPQHSAMSAGFRITPALWDKIHHFASFPQTGGMYVLQPGSGRILLFNYSFAQFHSSRWCSSGEIRVRVHYSKRACSSQVGGLAGIFICFYF